VFLALIVVAIIVGGGETPDAGDSIRTIKSFYADNDDKVMLGDAIGSIAGLFLVWFAASLRRAIHRVEGGDGRLATLVLVGGAAAMAPGSSSGSTSRWPTPQMTSAASHSSR